MLLDDGLVMALKNLDALARSGDDHDKFIFHGVAGAYWSDIIQALEAYNKLRRDLLGLDSEIGTSLERDGDRRGEGDQEAAA